MALCEAGQPEAPALEGLVLALTLKAECTRRIRFVVKDAPTQINLAAWAADLAERKAGGTAIPKGEQDDLATARAARLWDAGQVQGADRRRRR